MRRFWFGNYEKMRCKSFFFVCGDQLTMSIGLDALNKKVDVCRCRLLFLAFSLFFHPSRLFSFHLIPTHCACQCFSHSFSFLLSFFLILSHSYSLHLSFLLSFHLIPSFIPFHSFFHSISFLLISGLISPLSRPNSSVFPDFSVSSRICLIVSHQNGCC